MTQRITTFPVRYPLVNEHVREIDIVGYMTHEEAQRDSNYAQQIPELHLVYGSDNLDYFVRLKDGTSYSFLAGTPEFIREYMERENVDSFLSPGLIVVRNISESSIVDAVERWLEQGLNSRLGLGQYGCLQIAADE